MSLMKLYELSISLSAYKASPFLFNNQHIILISSCACKSICFKIADSKSSSHCEIMKLSKAVLTQLGITNLRYIKLIKVETSSSI